MKLADRKSLLFALGAAAAVWLIRKASGVAGVGKVERIKRRIYKEVSLAQSAGVDFSKKFDELAEDEIVVLESVGNDAGWKQSKRAKESGKSYAESYYGSLKRAWNAVSGCEGVGKAYNVKDADGNIVLTWIEDAAAHIEAERRLEAQERDLRKKRNAMKRRLREIDRKGLPNVNIVPDLSPSPEQLEHADEIVEELAKESVDDKRRRLLKKAQHMDIFLRIDGDKVVKDPAIWDQGGKGDHVRVDNYITARGDEREDFLAYINYLVVVHTRSPYYGTTIYPIRAFENKKAAQDFAKTLTKRGKNAKVVSIADIDIASISGIM